MASTSKQNTIDKTSNKTPSKHFGAVTNRTTQSTVKTSHGESTVQEAIPSYAPPSFKTSFVSSGKGGGGMRAIGDKLEVNAANGTLSFSLPIVTSSSRSDFQPQLTLSYDSGQGNGPFGFGWSVSVPSIQRSTARGIPVYNDNDDTFQLSGSEDLVPLISGDEYQEAEVDGYNVRQYQPRVVTNTVRIERWTELADPSEVHWRTISDQNVTTIYGQTDDSRILDRSGSSVRIFSWSICMSYDAFGNAIVFDYKSENEDGLRSNGLPLWELNRSTQVRQRKRYIKSIKYGNKAPARDSRSWDVVVRPTDWMFEVVFDYGEHDELSPATQEVRNWSLRKDHFSTCNAGFEVRSYRLCRRILMFHHFEELKRADSLVSSTRLKYNEYDHGTFMNSVVVCGHSAQGEGTKTTYFTETMPPITFEYSSAPSPQELELLSAQTADIHMLPAADSTFSEWIDLDGEGLPGILSRSQDGTMSFQRNHSTLEGKFDLDFGAVRYLARQPSFGYQQQYYLEDLDGTGRLDMVCLDAQGRLQGYFERIEHDSWADFIPFASVPTNSLVGDDIVRIDLSGDGLLDALHCREQNNTLWQPSLGKAGFGEQRSLQYLDKDPPRMKGNDRTAIYQLDMTGDGMADVVSVSNGKVSYWSNLGHGVFGAENQMLNAPFFDDDSSFNLARIRFVDVDGSGTTDILYLLPNGGMNLYYNLCGNSWSMATFVPAPQFDQLSSVVALDLLGNGTACLCWTRPSPGADGQLTLRYLDLMGSKKPYLLLKVSNGMGTVTEASYAPSTHFYLRDEANSKPWRTKLPFPVQCVKEVVITDQVTNITNVTKYMYHDGYYDGEEREFRGFGMVEHISEEHFPLPGGRSFQDGSSMTRTWYNTGSGRPSSHPCYASAVISDRIPDHLQSDDRRQAIRALRGSVARSEFYDNDGWYPQGVPYIVTENTLQVIDIQMRSRKTDHGVFRTVASETLTTVYERQQKDPRVSHQIVLSVNEYGDIRESATIHYPKKVVGEDPSRLKGQLEAHIEITEVDFTNTISNARNFRKPLPSSTKSYRLQGASVPSLLSVEGFRALMGKQTTPPSGKIKTGEKRLYLTSSDLTHHLPLGSVELYSVEAQTFDLAFTPEQLENTLSRAPSGKRAFIGEAIAGRAGYVDLDSDHHLWRPSPVYGFGHSAAAGTELSVARSSFYVRQTTTDPFGNKSYIKMDKYHLLSDNMIDAIGNETTAINDYERLQPTRLIDMNGNRHHSSLDCFGRVVGIASQGKEGDGIGESFENFSTYATPTDVESFFKKPNKELAKRLLGSATERTIFDLHRYARSSINVQGASRTLCAAAAAAHIARDGPGTSADFDVRINLTYLNGALGPYQVFDYCADEPSLWRCGECVFTNKQQMPVRSHLPFFAADHQPVSAAAINGPMLLNLHDALQRNVVELYPDGTWTKQVHTSWSKILHDAGDTVLEASPAANDEVRSVNAQLLKDISWKSWYGSRKQRQGNESKAALKSRVYHDTPVTTHLGPNEKVLLISETANGSTRALSYDYDLQGNLIAEYDALSRKNAIYAFDAVQNCVYKCYMDGGEEWQILNSFGKPFLLWNCRQIFKRIAYDQLHREIEVRVTTPDTEEMLVARSVYGEDCADAATSNLRGQLWRQSDQAGVTSFSAYDRRGNCTAWATQLCTEYQATIDWSKEVELEPMAYQQRSHTNYFDEETRSHDANGKATERTYNELGQVTSLRSASSDVEASSDLWKSYIVNATFSADLLPLSIQHGNKTVSTFEYDQFTRQLVSRKIARADGKVIESAFYSYDCMRRKIYMSNNAEPDIFFRNCLIIPEAEYTYDGFGQLVAATGRERIQAANGASSRLPVPDSSTDSVRGPLVGDGNQLCAYLEEYEYDLAGNLIQMKHQPTTDNKIQGWTRTYTYKRPGTIDKNTTSNRLSYTTVSGVEQRYGYDGDAGRAGHITSMPGFNSLTWNFEGLLASTTRQTLKDGTPETTYYVYNRAGRRVRKICERASVEGSPARATARKKADTLYLDNAEILRRFSGTGVHASTRTTSHVVGSSRVAMIEEDDAVDGDSLIRYEASHALELDDTGQVVSYEEYSPYGVCTYAASGKKVEADRRYRFARYLRDVETGFDLCGARYYVPWLGRWLSPDPVGTEGGTNLYCYSLNDPVNLTDPAGTEPELSDTEQALARRAMNAFRAEDLAQKFNEFSNSTTGKIVKGVLKAGALAAATATGLLPAYAAAQAAITVAEAGYKMYKKIGPKIAGKKWDEASKEAKEMAWAAVKDKFSEIKDNLVDEAIDAGKAAIANIVPGAAMAFAVYGEAKGILNDITNDNPELQKAVGEQWDKLVEGLGLNPFKAEIEEAMKKLQEPADSWMEKTGKAAKEKVGGWLTDFQDLFQGELAKSRPKEDDWANVLKNDD